MQDHQLIMPPFYYISNQSFVYFSGFWKMFFATCSEEHKWLFICTKLKTITREEVKEVSFEWLFCCHLRLCEATQNVALRRPFRQEASASCQNNWTFCPQFYHPRGLAVLGGRPAQREESAHVRNFGLRARLGRLESCPGQKGRSCEQQEVRNLADGDQRSPQQQPSPSNGSLGWPG